MIRPVRVCTEAEARNLLNGLHLAYDTLNPLQKFRIKDELYFAQIVNATTELFPNWHGPSRLAEEQ